MLKPEQVSEAVAKAAWTAFYNATGPTVADDWRAAIAAALNAWPGISKVGEVYGLQQEWWLELPLKEASDEPHP